MALRRSLPGIRLESHPPAPPDPLPRMDVAAFVGFAASGPINVPVAIEDPAEFRTIFGRDVLLPARRGATEAATAYLAGTVRAFFANGGRRCWIVRVAGPGAAVNRFPLPGVMRVGAGDVLEPVEVVARSEGSWSDPLRVATSLVSRPLGFIGVSPDAAGLSLDVAAAARRDVAIGDLVRVTWANVAASLHLFVQSVTTPVTSPPGTAIRLNGRAFWIAGGAVTTAVPSPATLTGPVMAERLAFDLTVLAETGAPVRLARLGFTPEHPRYLAALPSDATLFGESAEPLWADLWRDASLPRFPLAGALDRALYLPIGMGILPTEPSAPAIPAGATTLDRDGLAVFDSSLFLDPDLDDARVRDLVDRADAIRYQFAPLRRLTGLHAVLSIEDATMVAVPDLVHAGWERDGGGLPQSPLASSPLAASPLDHPETWRWFDCRKPRPATQPAGFGFIDCAATVPIPPPLLDVVEPAANRYTLRWDAVDGTSVDIEEATQPDFADGIAIVQSSGAEGVTLYDRPPGDYYYRARRLAGGRTSDWSFGVAVRVPTLSGWIGLDTYDAATLLEVQRALVRMCAARGDCVAVLALPPHYDAAAAIAHVTSLTALPTEPAALSYGAVWHPWIIRRDPASGALRASPPEGMMAAVMAARAIARGAWIAPANETLRGVVALRPSIPAETYQSLQDAAVNLIRQEPSGFVCLDADTLSTDLEVRPLNVRRLMILLRKVALRAGNRFTFEPNGERLRRAMKRGFEAALEEMFARGAFAGARSRDAFRVTTDEPPNTRQDADAGRFLAEIRVAPSQPLSFLTVRLVQRGESTVAQEVR